MCGPVTYLYLYHNTLRSLYIRVSKFVNKIWFIIHITNKFGYTSVDYTGNGNEKHELSHKMFNKTFALIVIAKFILFTNSSNSAYILVYRSN